MFRAEQAGDGEGVVADGLRRKTVARLAGNETIERIALPQGRGLEGALPVGTTRDQQAHEVFHVPPRLVELDGEVIEQFRVDRGFPLAPEVVEALGNPRPEDEIPEPVGHHPGRQAARSV